MKGMFLHFYTWAVLWINVFGILQAYWEKDLILDEGQFDLEKYFQGKRCFTECDIIVLPTFSEFLFLIGERGILSSFTHSLFAESSKILQEFYCCCCCCWCCCCSVVF
ncbi:hypothetical protein KP509_34G048000 [Ceratopteris richardii]|uniref:Uncharacterized protein n=1 Tax=Ceratopteris richardii TaxID=49495 RepID=A0A8T2QLN6_CERRI|nr:hypothetical protein KP509_34G048000 [Ceratopteris richardii]